MKKFLVLALPLLLLGCVQNLVRSPQFELREAGLLKLNPPGLNGIAPEAVIRISLEGRNPNPFEMSLSEFKFDLYLDGAKVAVGGTPGFKLKANGAPGIVPVDVEIPIAPSTVQNLLKIAGGSRVTYRVDGSFTVDAGALGKPRFGPVTLAQGGFQSPSLASQPPTFAWRSDLTRLTLGAGGAVFDLGFEVKNPAPIGYRLVAPLNLVIGGRVVAKAEAGGTIPARDKGVVYTRFQIDPIAAGTSLLSGQFNFEITGAPSLEVPGLQSYALPIGVLFGGTAKR
jgi:LEA14-like dessication related protein